MDPAHLHLLVNHVPILGSLFIVILGVYGLVRRQPEVVRAAVIALVAVGAMSFIALETGERAEEMVEHLPGFSERLIHEHAEAADVATYASIVMGLLALGVLIWRRRQPDVGLAPAVALLVGTAIVFGLMARVGNLGGQIHHAEIRPGATEQAAPAGDVGGRGEEGRYEDDD